MNQQADQLGPGFDIYIYHTHSLGCIAEVQNTARQHLAGSSSFDQ